MRLLAWSALVDLHKGRCLHAFLRHSSLPPPHIENSELPAASPHTGGPVVGAGQHVQAAPRRCLGSAGPSASGPAGVRCWRGLFG